MTRKVKQSRAAIMEHLREQVGFLRRSSAAYDQGEEAEAKRLAVILRILLHDHGKTSRSLLGHLGQSFRWRFVDSAFPYNPRNVLVHYGLVAVRFAPPPEGTRFVPVGMEAGRGLLDAPFLGWWDRDIVFKDSQAETFTRKRVVLTMADQDGGAHVDEALDQGYLDLARNESLGLSLIREGERIPWPNSPVSASVRQIAAEVLVTLQEQGLAG